MLITRWRLRESHKNARAANSSLILLDTMNKSRIIYLYGILARRGLS